MTQEDRTRLIDHLERLGERKVRLYSGIDCARFFGGWQQAEIVEAWLEDRARGRRRRPAFGLPFGRRHA
jgi:hypothetical protein